MGNFAVIKTYRNTVLTVYPKYSHKYDIIVLHLVLNYYYFDIMTVA